MSESGGNRAYLALGSNIRAESNLPAAAALLANFGRIAAVSSVWESSPVGDTNQANFLNAALLLETRLSATELKRVAIAEVEQSLGRVRDPQNKNAARTIDVDVALFNREVIHLGESRIPDPEILVRSFLAVPLAELNPDYRHPTDGRTLGEIADSLRTSRLFARPDVLLHDNNAARGKEWDVPL